MKAISLIIAACLCLIGCPSEEHSHCHTEECNPPPPPPPPPPPGGDVEVVDCAGATLAATITTDGFSYSPDAATIAVDDIVKFEIGGGHDAQSGTPGNPSDAFAVGFGDTVCLKFTVAGEFPFYCTPHEFTGSITVE